MKRTLVIILILAVACGIAGIARSECTETVIWQIGTPHGDVNPIDGADEYPKNTDYDPWVVYNIVNDPDPVNAPSIPGYLGPQNVCNNPNYSGTCIYSGRVVEIYFTLERGYEEEELILIYDRYGPKPDNLYLVYPDGSFTELGTVDGEKGEFLQNAISLSGREIGNYILVIEHFDTSGIEDGHFIDYLKLVVPPDCEEISVSLDIKPGSCPNPLNVKSKGVLPVALLGTEDFEVDQVDVASLRLEGVEALRSAFEDVATPFENFTETEDCSEDCNELGPDGYTDLTLKFDRQAIITTLGEVTDGDCLTLTLTGTLYDGTPIVGEDVVVILDRGKGKGPKEKGKKK